MQICSQRSGGSEVGSNRSRTAKRCPQRLAASSVGRKSGSWPGSGKRILGSSRVFLLDGLGLASTHTLAPRQARRQVGRAGFSLGFFRGFSTHNWDKPAGEATSVREKHFGQLYTRTTAVFAPPSSAKLQTSRSPISHPFHWTFLCSRLHVNPDANVPQSALR